jgi:hypothetical protein
MENIKLDHQGIGLESVYLFHASRHREKRRVVANMLMGPTVA